MFFFVFNSLGTYSRRSSKLAAGRFPEGDVRLGGPTFRPKQQNTKQRNPNVYYGPALILETHHSRLFSVTSPVSICLRTHEFLHVFCHPVAQISPFSLFLSRISLSTPLSHLRSRIFTTVSSPSHFRALFLAFLSPLPPMICPVVLPVPTHIT